MIREHNSTSSPPRPPPNGTTLNSSPSHQTVSGSHSPPPTQAEVIVVDSDSDSDEVHIYSKISSKSWGFKNIWYKGCLSPTMASWVSSTSSSSRQRPPHHPHPHLPRASSLLMVDRINDSGGMPNLISFPP